MKRRYLSAALAGLLLLTGAGCSFFDTSPTPAGTATTGETTVSYEESLISVLNGETMFTGEVPYTAAPRIPESTAAEPDETAEPATEPPTEAPQPATTQPPEEDDPSDSGTKVIGVSANGYQIVEVNGVTYVGGILIVNKTYSVPSSYAPGDLTYDCAQAYYRLQAAAAEEDLDFFIMSGYRSYATQTRLYNNYCARDGQAAADTYSARPGHSEHQTGLAIDVNSLSQSFAYTAEGKWLAANAHKYGFIIRYGADKQSVTGYAYEPWHIRYVGTDVAQAVYDSGLSLEEYLGITSVYE